MFNVQCSMFMFRYRREMPRKTFNVQENSMEKYKSPADYLANGKQ